MLRSNSKSLGNHVLSQQKKLSCLFNNAAHVRVSQPKTGCILGLNRLASFTD